MLPTPPDEYAPWVIELIPDLLLVEVDCCCPRLKRGDRVGSRADPCLRRCLEKPCRLEARIGENDRDGVSWTRARVTFERTDGRWGSAMSTYDVEYYAGEDVGDGMYHHAPRPRSAESLTASSVPPTPSAPIPIAQSDLLKRRERIPVTILSPGKLGI